MPTLHEILVFPPLGQADPYDTDTFMYYVSLMDENQIYGSSGGCYKGTQITADLVVDVSYDARREAKTAVLRFMCQSTSTMFWQNKLPQKNWLQECRTSKRQQYDAC